MTSNHFDTIVIGASLAGLTAAALSVQQGQRTALVASGPGSFALGSACLKTAHIAQCATHPGFAPAIAFFRDFTCQAGIPFEGDPAISRNLPTLLGQLQPVALAPHLQWNADLRGHLATAIVGIRGLSAFEPNFLADRLNHQATQNGLARTFTPRQVSLPLDHCNSLTTLRIATRFDRDPAFRDQLLNSLHHAAQGFQRILIPAILGLTTSALALAQFESQLGCTLAELPTLPPSIPALRLFHRLSTHLTTLGVEQFQGFPVSSLEIQNNLCSTVQIDSPARPLVLYPGTVILATGRQSTGKLRGPLRAANLFSAAPPTPTTPSNEVTQILSGYSAAHAAAATGAPCA